MPKGPSGQKRKADMIGNAVLVMKIATGEAEETADSRNPSAVALGSGSSATRFGHSSIARTPISPKPRLPRKAQAMLGHGRPLMPTPS